MLAGFFEERQQFHSDGQLLYINNLLVTMIGLQLYKNYTKFTNLCLFHLCDSNDIIP